MAFKAILVGETFIHSQRPFSVLGACPLSNSVTIGKLAAERAAQQIFFEEHGWNLNEADWMADTPFRTWHGITACIYIIQHWLSHKLGNVQTGHEENLVRALAANCRLYRNREDFDTISGEIREALAIWCGGNISRAFRLGSSKRRRSGRPSPIRALAKARCCIFPTTPPGSARRANSSRSCQTCSVPPGDIAIDAAALWGTTLSLGGASAAA